MLIYSLFVEGQEHCSIQSRYFSGFFCFKEPSSCPEMRTRTLCHFGLASYLKSSKWNYCGGIKAYEYKTSLE